jgi:hypothetical protein
VAPGSLLNANVGSGALLSSFGASSIVTVGATVSSVQPWLSGSPVLPAVSVARTSKLCVPSSSGPTGCGLAHGA